MRSVARDGSALPFADNRSYVKKIASPNPKRKNRFHTRTDMVISSSMESLTMLTNPLWLTALASLVSSLASLVWALRRKR